jgi:hypothetical protein
VLSLARNGWAAAIGLCRRLQPSADGGVNLTLKPDSDKVNPHMNFF